MENPQTVFASLDWIYVVQWGTTQIWRQLTSYAYITLSEVSMNEL